MVSLKRSRFACVSLDSEVFNYLRVVSSRSPPVVGESMNLTPVHLRRGIGKWRLHSEDVSNVFLSTSGATMTDHFRFAFKEKSGMDDCYRFRKLSLAAFSIPLV